MDRSRTNYLYSQSCCFLLTPQQAAYPTHDQELLAIVDACQYFQYILLGIHFYVVTDNSSLKSLLHKPTKQLNNRQIRWLEILSKLDFEIIHIPGAKTLLLTLFLVFLKKVHLPLAIPLYTGLT